MTDQILQVIGALLAMLGVLFMIWKFLTAKIERGDDRVNARVDLLEKDAVTHEEFSRHMTAVEHRMDRLDKAVSDHNNNLNSRFDQLMLALNNWRGHKGPEQ